MWVLSVPRNVSSTTFIRKCLLPDKEYLVGRNPDASICLNYPFVSGKQLVVKTARASAGPNSGSPSELRLAIVGRTTVLINDKDKYKQSPDGPKSLSITSTVTNILLGNKKKGTVKLVLRWIPLQICYSRDGMVEMPGFAQPVSQYLGEMLDGLDVAYTPEITKSTTHFLKTAKLSSKFTLALVRNLKVVDVGYIKAINDRAHLEFVTKYDALDAAIPNRSVPPSTSLIEYNFDKYFPNYKDFLPEPSFDVNEERPQLFKPLVFFVSNELQFKHLQIIIESAGGHIRIYDLAKKFDTQNADDKMAVEKCIDSFRQFCSLVLEQLPSGTRMVFMKNIFTDENATERVHYTILRKVAKRFYLPLMTNKEFYEAIKDVSIAPLIKRLADNYHSDTTNSTDTKDQSTEIATTAGKDNGPQLKRKRMRTTKKSLVKPLDAMSLYSGSNSPSVGSEAEKATAENANNNVPQNDPPEPELQVEKTVSQINYNPKEDTTSRRQRPLKDLPQKGLDPAGHIITSDGETTVGEAGQPILERPGTLANEKRQRRKKMGTASIDDLYRVTQNGAPAAGDSLPANALPNQHTGTNGDSDEINNKGSLAENNPASFTATQKRKRRRINAAAIDDLYGFTQSAPVPREEASRIEGSQDEGSNDTGSTNERAEDPAASEIAEERVAMEPASASQLAIPVDQNSEANFAAHYESKPETDEKSAELPKELSYQVTTKKISFLEAVKRAKEAESNIIKEEQGDGSDNPGGISKEELKRIRRKVQIEEFTVGRNKRDNTNGVSVNGNGASGNYRDWSTRKNFKRFVKNLKSSADSDPAAIARLNSSVYRTYVTFDVFDPIKDNQHYKHQDEDEDLAFQSQRGTNNEHVGSTQNNGPNIANGDKGEDKDERSTSQFHFSRPPQESALFVPSEDEEGGAGKNSAIAPSVNATTSHTRNSNKTRPSNVKRGKATPIAAPTSLDSDDDEEESSIPKFRFSRR